jgi:CheY-like chemotaxis protein
MTCMLPLFYFRPTICWIDDDRIFLDAVSITFREHYNCLTFDMPFQAIHYFSEYQAPLSQTRFIREFTESDLHGTNNHFPVDLCIPTIAELINIEGKYNEIAVAIIDYNMPNMNGLELCKKLQNFPFKKILLTGEAENQEVIKAFNDGIIDRFIRKDNNVAGELKKYISQLTNEYFYEKSANIISYLESSKVSVLSDQIFIEFFKEWLNENSITEYYLFNKQGSFLVKNKDGKLSYFVVMSEQDKSEFVQLNDDAPEEMQSLLRKLTTENMVPFFGHGKESWEISLDKWKNYFFPAKTIEGRDKYYWIVLND